MIIIHNFHVFITIFIYYFTFLFFHLSFQRFRFLLDLFIDGTIDEIAITAIITTKIKSITLIQTRIHSGK